MHPTRRATPCAGLGEALSAVALRHRMVQLAPLPRPRLHLRRVALPQLGSAYVAQKGRANCLICRAEDAAHTKTQPVKFVAAELELARDRDAEHHRVV